MDFQTAQQRAQQLREQIEYYSKLYYEQDDPAISDYDFDKLMHELIDIEETYPELLTPDSPTHRVGGKASNSFAPVEHVVQMGSLQDVFSSEEVEDFDRRVREDCAESARMWWSRRLTAFRSRWNIGTACWCAAPPAATALSARM